MIMYTYMYTCMHGVIVYSTYLLVSQSEVGECYTSTLLHLMHTNITEHLPKI